MNETKSMKLIRELFEDAIITELNTPYLSRTYDGIPKRGISPRRASGSLIKSLKVEWTKDFESGDPLLIASFDTEFEDLYEVIDQGRRPSLKYPPLKAIENWIKIKPIRFQNITLKSITFLIARSIKEKGFGGINFVIKAEDKVLKDLETLAEDAALDYISNVIDEGLINVISRNN